MAKRRNREEKVQLLALFLGDEPTNDVLIENIYRTRKTNEERFDALVDLAYKQGRLDQVRAAL